MQRKEVVSDQKLYIVVSLQPAGPRAKGVQWTPVSEEPIPRTDAVRLVAQEWGAGRKARATLHTH